MYYIYIHLLLLIIIIHNPSKKQQTNKQSKSCILLAPRPRRHEHSMSPPCLRRHARAHVSVINKSDGCPCVIRDNSICYL
jgi:hypothetical protein